MIYVIKIGGNIIDNPDSLKDFLRFFAEIQGHKILIHGGGKIATHIADQLQIPQQMYHGRRITDQATLDVVTMVYTGLINKNIVADLHAYGCPSLGVCGADANIVLADKRPVKEVDFGFVGDLTDINGEVIYAWLKQDLTPVIAPISHDGKGQLLNTNADTMASGIAIALSTFEKVNLIYCFEKKGVMMDIDDENSVIKSLNENDMEELKEKGLIHSGMLPKLDNALQTVKAGVESVIIGHAIDLPLLTTGESGTKITLS